MTVNMGDWNIDRAYSYLDEQKLNRFYINIIDSNLDSNYSRDKLLDILIKNNFVKDDAKNKSASMTNFKDYGYITDNSINQNGILLVNKKITYNEFIFDIIFKRSSRKGFITGVKPFILLCIAFYLMKDCVDVDDFYLT